MTTKIDAARTRLADAERALADLKGRVARLDDKIAAEEERGGHGGFADFMAEGDRALTRPDLPTLRADREAVAKLVAAGELSVTSRRGAVADAEREERQARIASMTMSDAIMYARDALAAIDVEGAERDLAKIASSVAALHDPRLRARDRQQAAIDTAAVRANAGRADVAAEAQAAQQGCEALRRQLGTLDTRHARTREDLRDAVTAAFAHVARLAAAEAEHAKAHADTVASFAAAVASPGRRMPTLVRPLALELPSGGELDDLRRLAAPALRVAATPLPTRPDDREYQIHAPGTIRRNAA